MNKIGITIYLATALAITAVAESTNSHPASAGAESLRAKATWSRLSPKLKADAENPIPDNAPTRLVEASSAQLGIMAFGWGEEGMPKNDEWLVVFLDRTNKDQVVQYQTLYSAMGKWPAGLPQNGQ